MDLSNVSTHFQSLEKIGFISNCPPNVNIQIAHDDVRAYCEHLNQLAISKGLYNKEPYASIHLNEQSGDFIAIYKVKGSYKSKAMGVLNTQAELEAAANGRPRKW